MALLTLAMNTWVSTVNGSDASLDSHGAWLKPPWSTKISFPLRVMKKAHPTGGDPRPSSVWSAFHCVDRHPPALEFVGQHGKRICIGPASRGRRTAVLSYSFPSTAREHHPLCSLGPPPSNQKEEVEEDCQRHLR